MKEVGIEFPPEASAAYFEAQSQLVVRNLQGNQDLVGVFVESLAEKDAAPKVVNLRAEIYSLPKLDALVLVERFDDRVNTDGAVVELRKLVAADKARLIASPSLVTRSGQRAEIGSGNRIPIHSRIHRAQGRRLPAGENDLLRHEPRSGADGFPGWEDSRYQPGGEQDLQRTGHQEGDGKGAGVR